ncbi:Cyclopentanone 1,2-monooxygenase (CPMO) [Mortierella alpina]|nr:Cyclopentanone 1,2-monooxygenase (CPMO) [Mortierella alpina]
MSDAAERKRKLEALAAKRASDAAAPKPAAPAKKAEVKSSSKPKSSSKSKFPGKGRSLRDDASDDDDDDDIIDDDEEDDDVERDISEQFSDVDSDNSDRPRSKKKSAPAKKSSSSRRSPPPKRKAPSSSSKSKPSKKKRKGSDSDEDSENFSEASESEGSGGASGLSAIKECLDEKEFIDVVAFEQQQHLGGLWRYTEVSEETPNPHSSVYKSTIINVSKQSMSYSDFAIPIDWPTYLPHQKVAHYFDMYAERFQLREHIRFGAQVVEVRELHDENKRWVVRWHPVAPSMVPEEAEIKEEIFDYVMMCSGHHWKPRYPDFPGMDPNAEDAYTGDQIHSHFYRQADVYRDKTVVVVGLGNSGVDLAVELSLNQSEVYLSCRRPCWVAPRWLLGKPLDHFLTRLGFMPPLIVIQLVFSLLFKMLCPPTHKNMKPETLPLGCHPTVSTLLPERISTGTVKPSKNIKKLGPGKKVLFEDGTEVEADAVLYCTGYHITFPVLDPEIVTDGKPNAQENNEVWTWKYMIPPRHPNLAFIGLGQPLGALMPLAEMQCRFLIHTLVGKSRSLPSEKQMDKDIAVTKKRINKRFYNAPRHTIQLDSVPYCDELAKKVGCFPTLAKLVARYGLLEGLRLKTETIVGPAFPVQYRLVGPHAWEGARDVTWGYAGKEAYWSAAHLQDNTTATMKLKNKPHKDVVIGVHEQ